MQRCPALFIDISALLHQQLRDIEFVVDGSQHESVLIVLIGDIEFGLFVSRNDRRTFPGIGLCRQYQCRNTFVVDRIGVKTSVKQLLNGVGAVIENG